MKINQCQFCDSEKVIRSRYIGVSFWVLTVLTLGLTFLGFPWLPLQIRCRSCGVEYIAS